jgi:hypothetical protein
LNLPACGLAWLLIGLPFRVVAFPAIHPVISKDYALEALNGRSRHVNEVTTLGCIQFRHWLHNAAGKKLIPQSRLLDHVRSKNFGDDDIRAKSRHDESSGNLLFAGVTQ